MWFQGCTSNFSRNVMAMNTTNRMSSEDQWMPVPASRCLPWLVFRMAEYLVIISLNIIIMLVFVKQRQLQRRSTYLIINLTIVDMLVGSVGPLFIVRTGSSRCDLWKYNWPDVDWINILTIHLGVVLPLLSFFNLAVISLERAHATFRPLKHRYIRKWVYGVLITATWLVPLAMHGVGIALQRRFPRFNRNPVQFSYYFFLVFVICVSYIAIYIKVRCALHPQHHGATGQRDRKLTTTLCLVSLVSLFTVLPMLVSHGVASFNMGMYRSFYRQSSFDIDMIKGTFFMGNSLINPIIYTMRMPGLRAGILHIICRRASNPVRPLEYRLRGLWIAHSRSITEFKRRKLGLLLSILFNDI